MSREYMQRKRKNKINISIPNCYITMEEVAKELGITKEGVRKLQNSVLAKLKKQFLIHYKDDLKARNYL